MNLTLHYPFSQCIVSSRELTCFNVMHPCTRMEHDWCYLLSIILGDMRDVI